MFTVLLLCNRGWWNEVHWIPLSDFVHCLFLLQFTCLCSLPAFFRQLKQTWLAFATFTRSAYFMAASFWHWSGQWEESEHYQHLCQSLHSSSTLLPTRFTLWQFVEPFHPGAIALMRDFISTVIQLMRRWSVAVFLFPDLWTKPFCCWHTFSSQ